MMRLRTFLRPVSSNDEIEKLPNYSADRIHFNWGDHDSLPPSTTKGV